MTLIHRTHYRCTDSVCGWQGFEGDLGERVDREAWNHTRPQIQYEVCCPKCFQDVTEGAWCPTCGQHPMNPSLDECEACFEKTEAKQRETVRAYNENARILKIQEAVRTYHARKNAMRNGDKAKAAELTEDLRRQMGLPTEKAS